MFAGIFIRSNKSVRSDDALAVEAAEKITTQFLSTIKYSFKPLRHHPEFEPICDHRISDITTY